MTVDSTVVPGLLLLALELLALAAVGYVVARVALGQTDDRMALAQGLVIGPALWGLIVNFLLHVLPGLVGAVAGWAVVLACGAALAWRTPSALRLRPRTVVGFLGATLGLFWVALASRQLLGIPDENIHVALASTIRGGQYPPVLSWTPELPLPYHHGVDLLVGLMTPPAGPGPRVHDRSAGRLRLDRIRPGYCNGSAAAWRQQCFCLDAAGSHHRRVDACLVRRSSGHIASPPANRGPRAGHSSLPERHLLAVGFVALDMARRGVAAEHTGSLRLS